MPRDAKPQGMAAKRGAVTKPAKAAAKKTVKKAAKKR
jgi:hypothetical protein